MTGSLSLIDPDGDFRLTTVQVQTLTSRDGRGNLFAAAAPRDVFVEDERRLVRDDNGDQVISETTVFDHLDQAALYRVGSKVTVHDRTARVIAVKRRELDAEVDHLEIALT